MKDKYFRHSNLSSLVVDYLKDKILFGELKEGERILEVSIAEELDISRAPVREGIKELENQGLVISVPRKGNFVVKLNENDIREIFDIRLLLETSVMEKLINEKTLTQEDFLKLKNLIEEMEEIAEEKDDNDNHKAVKINEKDMLFHTYIWDKSGSKRKVKILSDLYLQLRMAMLIDTRLTGDLSKTAKDHYDVIEFLELGDIEKCREALKNHIISYN